MPLMTPGPIMLQTEMASWPAWQRYAFAAILLAGGIAGMWINRPSRAELREMRHWRFWRDLYRG
jgi:hypothetical protein